MSTRNFEEVLLYFRMSVPGLKNFPQPFPPQLYHRDWSLPLNQQSCKQAETFEELSATLF